MPGPLQLLAERRQIADNHVCMTVCLQDFVSAVMDVDYSPTGREFVAGSYDRSVRIFAHQGGHSREVRLH
jgi:WD40 repeat protein